MPKAADQELDKLRLHLPKRRVRQTPAGARWNWGQHSLGWVHGPDRGL